MSMLYIIYKGVNETMLFGLCEIPQGAGCPAHAGRQS